MERPERRRREGRRSVRFAFGRRSSLFCVPVLFLYLCLLWVYVFYGFYVGPAKLQRGATPPFVMVLFSLSSMSKYQSLRLLGRVANSCRENGRALHLGAQGHRHHHHHHYQHYHQHHHHHHRHHGQEIRDGIVPQIRSFFEHCSKGRGGSNPWSKILEQILYDFKGILAT